MRIHRNAKLGLQGRLSLVRSIEDGLSVRAAASEHSVSPATACKWWRRWREASAAERSSRSCLEDRSSRPHRSPRMLSAQEQARICALRQRTGWGPRPIAARSGHPHATVWRALRRAGLSRKARPPREQPRRYEWPCPGDLLHLDWKRFGRFERPGHAVTGIRDRTGAEKRLRVGYDYLHSLVDDHSRLAYTEVHRDARAPTVVGFLERALAVFAGYGIEPKRVMSDNAWSYTKSRAFVELLAAHRIKHLLIDKGRPQTNGKVERYQQTLRREWALGQSYRSSEHRAHALSHWLDYYNTRRPHSALRGRPPISRVQNLSRHDN